MAKLKTIDDYGHGGADSGAVAGGVYEKTLVLDLGRRVTKGQKEQGIIVETTRSTDVTLANGTRTAIVRNSGAKYCFSYHKNSSTNKLAHGFEIWVSQYSNQRMAKAIEAELKAIGLHSRGVRVRKTKSGKDYYFMHRNTGSVETLIIENLFISNDKDRAYLSNASNRQKIADAIVRAICKVEGIKYNGNKPSSPPTSPPSTNKPKPVPPTTNKLAVDGYWGKATTRALQKVLKTPIDGVISGQYSNSVTRAISGVSFTNRNGSSMVRALQRKVGVKVDGFIGTDTIRALQRYLKTPIDGKISKPSTMVRELQRRLNAGTF